MFASATLDGNSVTIIGFVYEYNSFYNNGQTKAVVIDRFNHLATVGLHELGAVRVYENNGGSLYNV